MLVKGLVAVNRGFRALFFSSVNTGCIVSFSYYLEPILSVSQAEITNTRVKDISCVLHQAQNVSDTSRSKKR